MAGNGRGNKAYNFCAVFKFSIWHITFNIVQFYVGIIYCSFDMMFVEWLRSAHECLAGTPIIVLYSSQYPIHSHACLSF